MRNRITGLVGPTGSGKTFKAVELFCREPRSAAYNIVEKDAQYLACATLMVRANPRALCIALAEEDFRIVYRPGQTAKDDRGMPVYPDLDWFVKLCMTRGDMTMVIDEAHWLCDPYRIPAPLFEALALGRFERLSTIYVTQSWSMVHRLLTRNSHEFYFWRIIEPSDLSGIRERCGPDVAEQVAELKRTEDHRPEGGELVAGGMLHWSTWNGIEPDSRLEFFEESGNDALHGREENHEGSLADSEAQGSGLHGR